MRLLVATARNITLSVEGDEIQPFVEMVFTICEAQYQLDGVGNVSRIQIPETVRFSAGPAETRQIAKKLIGWADECDKAGEQSEAGKLRVFAPDKEPD
jgi:hypothetical protein